MGGPYFPIRQVQLLGNAHPQTLLTTKRALIQETTIEVIISLVSRSIRSRPII